MRVLERLLRPKSIAVLGSGWAENVVAQCDKMGFDGAVWPVHPRRESLGGRRAFASLADLPSAPDATFIGVNRQATVDVVRALSEMGAGGGVCFASGWSETGDHDLQAKLISAAGDMPFLGPNCYGLINFLDGALLWPDQHGGRRVERGVALISQSSNIAINLTMQARGLPIAYIACLGNAAQTGLADLGGALLADERVTALGLYLEGIDDAAALAEITESARRAGKHIVALKSGKSDAAVAAAASHTAALAGDSAAASAYLARIGVAEVDTLDVLLETLKILHVHGPLPGHRVAAVCCSGGEAGLTADLIATTTLEAPPPSPTQRQALSEQLGPLVTIANPLDYHTFIWGDRSKMTEVFATMIADYDAGLFLFDWPRPDRCDPSSFLPGLEAIEAAGRRSGTPAFPIASLPENFDEALAVSLIERGVAPLMGMETGLRAVQAAAEPGGAAGDGWRPWPAKPTPPDTGEASILSEQHAKDMLRLWGVDVPNGIGGPTLEGLRPLAKTLRAPLALKGLGLAHKTEAGAVRLGLSNLDNELEMPGVSGYLVEEMIVGGVAELLIGLRRDPIYGASLTLGIGGVEAELLADTVTLIAPATPAEIAAALRRLRLWPLLDGYRGRPKADVGAAVAVAGKLQELMAARPELLEIEINPLILRADGAVAVDALIRQETS
ncbi:MAG: acetate--CoA ligase family protein [Rhodobacteraceae bacterium]|nr:acetate--CoA ligase family protein [Paracoccaceae bacterium]